jgi:hypothetical protein
MILVDSNKEIEDALTRLASKPETSRPFVIVQHGEGGPFVQFYGSAERGIHLDLPEQGVDRFELAKELTLEEILAGRSVDLEIGATDFGWKIEKVSPESGARYAVCILGKLLGVSARDEVQIVEHGKGASSS